MDKSSAIERLGALFDDGIFTQIDAFVKASSGDLGVAAGYGAVNGETVYAFAQDTSGAISTAQCKKILKVYDLAKKTGCPVIGIYDSNGVDLKEGFEVLSAYGELVKASASVSGVCLQLSIIAGACLGTSALIANMADAVIAVKDADFYVSAPSDITAKQSSDEGTIDILADSFDEAVGKCRELVAYLPANNLSVPDVFDFTAPEKVTAAGDDATAVLNSVADEGSVIEFKKDYAKNCVTALATINGMTVGIVAFDGKALCPACCYKAESLVKLCDAYSLPVITLVNSEGVDSEKENQTLTALTKLTSSYASATSPKVSLIFGKAVGGAYLTLAGKGANADYTIAWNSAVTSALDISSAVAFMYNDRLANGESRDALENEYITSEATPYAPASIGAVDDIIAPENSRAAIITALDMLQGKRENTLPRKHSVK